MPIEIFSGFMIQDVISGEENIAREILAWVLENWNSEPRNSSWPLNVDPQGRLASDADFRSALCIPAHRLSHEVIPLCDWIHSPRIHLTTASINPPIVPSNSLSFPLIKIHKFHIPFTTFTLNMSAPPTTPPLFEMDTTPPRTRKVVPPNLVQIPELSQTANLHEPVVPASKPSIPSRPGFFIYEKQDPDTAMGGPVCHYITDWECCKVRPSLLHYPSPITCLFPSPSLLCTSINALKCNTTNKIVD
jgi:hypothetical protein